MSVLPYFRVTLVDRAQKPGDPQIVKNDRVEFVDAEGNVTDVSSATSAIDVLGRVGSVRKLRLDVLRFTIETEHEERHA